ncbi:sensor histidine kinase [Brevibacillus massiliensis]|uniref:sensor histidine kinase n=1 Tax=Brevibacillus massiliensis TaxID=1118054 RepID=UPI00054E33FD|nr:HAMP domain-containing sensor histidine kinase [Brevibacillus massiliensis]
MAIRLFPTHRSLAWRLTFFLSCGMFVFLLSFSIFVYINTTQLFNQHEQRLLEQKGQSIRSDLTAAMIENPVFGLADLTQTLSLYSDVNQSILLLSPEGKVLAAFPGVSWKESQKKTYWNVLVTSQTINLPGYSGPLQITILQSLEPFLPFFHYLLITLSLASIGILAFSVFGSYGLTQLGLRPLTRFISQIHTMNKYQLIHPIAVTSKMVEIDELIVAFNTLLKRVEEAMTKQKQFIDDASHEFRTPLTIIEGYLRLLMRWGKEREDVREEALAAMSHECTRLFRLIDDLLRLAKLQNSSVQAYHIELQSLVPILEETKLAWSPVYTKQVALFFEWEEPLTAPVDKEKIRQLLDILLDNARKYTREGEVRVTAHRHAGWIHLHVIDTGIGIPEEKIPHLFERFFRVETSRNREQGGSGLGLAIANSIVEAHGGTISISSPPAGGADVHVKLPAVQP